MLSQFVLLFVLLSPQAAPQAAVQSPAPTAAQTTDVLGEDPAVTALALKIYGQIRAGKVDEALLTEEMNKQLGPAALAQFKPIFEQLGDPRKLTLTTGTKTARGNLWVYQAVFAAAQLQVRILVAPDGRVAAYRLTP